MLTKAFIPYKGYYSTPFCRWQGSLSNENPIVLGAETSKKWLALKDWDPKMLDYLFLGITVTQHHVFYASTWASALMGAERIPGVTVMQACSTSTSCIFQASLGIENGLYRNAYCLMTDRVSNGPHIIWPNPKGPGGQVEVEDWVMDNFASDPWAGLPMVVTADNVGKEAGLTREECDALALRRYEQYTDALANDRAFQKQYMVPVEIKVSKKKTRLVEEDEGITLTTKEGLAALKPVSKGGLHTYGSQTHPADANAGIIVTTREKAKELSASPDVEIQVLSNGYFRAKKGYMAAAVAPAAKMALENANIGVKDVKVIKTHNPFAANDLAMAKELGIDAFSFNNYGSTMIYGHPQAPAIARLMIEGIEEIKSLGGGYLLVAGCAAGDTAGALVLKIG